MVTSVNRNKRRSAEKTGIAFGRVVTNTHTTTDQRKSSIFTTNKRPQQKLAASKNHNYNNHFLENEDMYHLQTEVHTEVTYGDTTSPQKDNASSVLQMSPNVKEEEMLM